MITTLTKEQEIKIPDYLNKWLDVGHRTKEIDDKKAIDAIDFLYENILKMPKPKEYVKSLSPLACNEEIKKRGGEACSYPTISNWYLRYYWFWTCDFILNELFPEKKPNFVLYEEFMSHMQNLHFVYLFDDTAFYCEFPKTIEKNSFGLHKEFGKALEYRDGYGLFSLNGTIVPDYVCNTKIKDITKDMIINEKNADYRRELMRRIPAEKLIDILEPDVIDSEYGYELYSISIDEDRKRPYLKMINPSLGCTHIEGVKPGVKTVREAIMYRNNLAAFQLPISIDGVLVDEGSDYYQHGDCLIFNSEIPKGAIECNHNIAGEGLRRHYLEDAKLFELDGIRYIKAGDTFKITHPEHKDAIISSGTYVIKKVMEYDHFLEESREVID